MIHTLEASELAIPFKLAFSHASATRARTQAILVVAASEDGARGYGEGCPREYVTGESLATALKFIAKHEGEWQRQIDSIASLQSWVVGHEREIDANPAAWCAVECALLDLLARLRGCTAEALLGLPPLEGRFRYTAVIGDGSQRQFEAQLARYLKAGFRDFKVKLAGDVERDRGKAAALREARINPARVRIDANNLWSDAGTAIDYLRALGFGFSVLEEPLRAGDYAGMARIAAALGARVILDESMTRPEQLDSMPGAPDRWIVNLRVSKMGGVLRSLALLRRVRQLGLPVIVGAHVGETSLLSRAALTVARAAGGLLVAQEGAFGTHLLERDVAEPPLMFGAGGVLEAGSLGGAPGWGVEVRVP